MYLKCLFLSLYNPYSSLKIVDITIFICLIYIFCLTNHEKTCPFIYIRLLVNEETFMTRAIEENLRSSSITMCPMEE